MGLKNLSVKTNRTMEKGEENLYKVFTPEVEEGKGVILAGIDGGSTQTRVCLMDSSDNEDSLEQVYTIPSVHSIYSENTELKKSSEVLYDCMDSWITNKDLGNSLFVRTRVLRGTKFIDANLGDARINSSIQKIDSLPFYVNLIDSLAYSLIQKYPEKLKKEYDCYLGVSLPPDNINSVPNRNKFLKNLKGSYEWYNKDLGISITINIKEVSVQTEPESEIKASYALSGEEVPEWVVLIEGGGSTMGIEVLRGGVSVKSAAITFPYGGTQLQSDLGKIYSQAKGGRALALSTLKAALETGYLKQGRSQIDVVPYIIEAKDKFAERIYSDFTTLVVDNIKSFDLSLVDTIVFAGRLFNNGHFPLPKRENSYLLDESLENTEYSNEEIGYSLSEPLTALLRKSAPDANFEVLDRNYIPSGNLLLAYTEFGGYITDDLVEGEEEDFSSIEE